jgi:hypothetical protein
MLVTGQTAYSMINELSGVRDQYDLMFEILFGNQYKKAGDLHSIACSDRYDVFEMLQSSYSDNDENVHLRVELRRNMFDRFFSEH